MVEVEGRGLVDVQPYMKDNAVIVHIVNLNQAGFWKGPVDEIVPLPGQSITAKIPEGRRAGAAKLLVSDRMVEAVENDGMVVIRIPSIDGAHEVAVLEFE